MKILFFSSYFYPYVSGLTIYPWRILSHLSQKHEITVLTFNHFENLLKISNFKLKIYYLPYLLKISKGFISIQSKYFFIGECLKNDIIILNLPNAEASWLAIFGKVFGKKIISIYHCQVKLAPGLINWLANLYLNLHVFIQLSLSKIIISYPESSSKLLDLKIFRKKIKTCLPPIISYPIDKKFFQDLLKQKKDKKIVGFVGRIAQEKGLEYLIRGVKSSSVALWLAGPKKTIGEDKYHQFIISLLKKNKIDLKIFKNLSNSQLSAFYKAVDVLVLPSVNQTEAFGMVQAEAMLTGTPVIATNLPGVRLPIQLTKMGVLIEPKNTQQLSNAIKTVINNRPTYINKKLINKAKKIFDISKVFNFYEKIIN